MKGILIPARMQVALEDIMSSDRGHTPQGWCHQTHRDRKWSVRALGRGGHGVSVGWGDSSEHNDASGSGSERAVLHAELRWGKVTFTSQAFVKIL